MEFGYVGNDYLTDKFQATINGKKEFLNIADFNEFKWGTYYKVVLRGYTDVRCGIQDAPRDVRYYEVEKIISKLSVPEQTCFEEYIPSSRRNNPKNLYTTWKERFSKLDSQISTEDSQFIKVNIGNHKIGYRICILDPGKSKIRIDNVAIRP